jgi:hypothetical protein
MEVEQIPASMEFQQQHNKHSFLCDLMCSVIVVDHDAFHECLHVMWGSQSASHDKVMRVFRVYAHPKYASLP